MQLIEQAAKDAYAHEFIIQTPEKYDTNIGDKGVKLSGGQKQRISLARALLRNPDVFILDEATSALDTESEKYIQNALEKIMKNKTAIIIAHRLSTIRNADRIIVIEEGKIVEEGTHDQLLNLNGTYANFVNLQAF
jgi:ABC-type multidrug transport system fused ATPase/permease subunit